MIQLYLNENVQVQVFPLEYIFNKVIPFPPINVSFSSNILAVAIKVMYVYTQPILFDLNNLK